MFAGVNITLRSQHQQSVAHDTKTTSGWELVLKTRVPKHSSHDTLNLDVKIIDKARFFGVPHFVIFYILSNFFGFLVKNYKHLGTQHKILTLLGFI